MLHFHQVYNNCHYMLCCEACLQCRSMMSSLTVFIFCLSVHVSVCLCTQLSEDDGMLAHWTWWKATFQATEVWSGSTPLMVYQPDECITFSKVDEDKLPYYIYKQGASNSENSGGSTVKRILRISPGVKQPYAITHLEINRSCLSWRLQRVLCWLRPFGLVT